MHWASGAALRVGFVAVAWLALSVCVSAATAATGALHDPRGLWEGKLQSALRIVVHVDADSAGALSATVDSPDQGALGLPVSTTSYSGDTLRLELSKLGASYVGRMSTDGFSIAGEWYQSGQVLPLTIARIESIAAPRRPQEPQPPYPYVIEEVRYPGGAKDVSIAGTLTLPRGAGPFPCALMITGSGPENRDEMVFGHRPFWIIADDLTRAGIAVLRVDDRGVGGSTGSARNATSADFTADVLEGLKFLATRHDIDPRRTGLIGHSEGGLIAPMAAVRAPRSVAFIVMLAGPGVPGRDILDAQGEAIARAMGAGDADIAQQRRLQHKLFALAPLKLDSVAVVARVREIFREEGVDSAKAELQLGQSVAVARSPWFRFFLEYDPRPALRQVKCPVLALNGSVDLQVPPRQNLPEIEKSLKEGGNRDCEVRELPGLNHLFQTSTTGSPAEYGKLEETIAPVALTAMREWIMARMRKE